MGASADRAGAFFGRRKGKRLRAGQEDVLRTLLPRLQIRLDGLDPLALFPPRPSAVFLEIGFGGGEHLAARARAHSEIGFIGCEPFVNGMAKLLRVVADEGLDNIRLCDRDAAELLAALPSASIDQVCLLYPDPWPKRRQRKRRFVSDQTAAVFARVLKPGGEFRFATDIDDYAGWTLACLARSPEFRWTAERAADWREPWPDWPGTRYEAKALAEGREPAYLTFERR
jgi:tRNA (guanine-N7-)-methyltransferase